MDQTTGIAIGVVISAVVAGIVSLMLARSNAKKSDLELLRSTYTAEIARLNLASAAQEETAKGRQSQIKELFDQIVGLRNENIILIQKIADQDVLCAKDKAELMIRIVALESTLAANPALSGTGPMPVQLVGPLPLPMTMAQIVKAVVAETAAAELNKESST